MYKTQLILKTKIVFSLNIGFNEETIPFCTVKTFFRVYHLIRNYILLILIHI